MYFAENFTQVSCYLNLIAAEPMLRMKFKDLYKLSAPFVLIAGLRKVFEAFIK